MGTEHYQQLEIGSDYRQAQEAEDRVMAKVEAYDYDEEVVFALRLSLEEALSNAIRHGNKEDPSKRVRIRYLVTADRVDLYVEDEGEGFDPSGVADPTAEENLENPSGRGIMLMRAYMTQVEYNAVGNGVHLVKLKQAG